MLAALACGPSAERGAELYAENCVLCHGQAGEGGTGPDLTSREWQSAVSDEDIERVVREGIAGTAMPPFGSELDLEDRRALVSFVRTLAKEAVQKTTDVTAPEIHVTPEQIARPGGDPEGWLTYAGDLGARRFSPHDQIHRGNVEQLAPLWSFQTGVADGLEATPLYVDGILYLSTSWNHLFAIDARTGAEIWHYKRRLPQKLKLCCGAVNRGVAILGGNVFMATADAHLVALDARTGRLAWEVELGKVEDNLSSTGAPLAFGKQVVIGVGGGDYASRGFLDAYDAETGRRLWRFWTIPGKGEPGVETWSGDSYEVGGGATWTTGSYDPELNLLYWGISNPYPKHEGFKREGDNLYTDSIVALDPATGALRWHFQMTPHDLWDYAGVNENVFVDLERDGRRVKALIHADRNGYFYALDRVTGDFLFAEPFVRVTWNLGMTPEGRPIPNPAAVPTYEGVEVCPGAAGGKEWNGMAYSPQTRLAYVPVAENCAVFYSYSRMDRLRGRPRVPSGIRYVPGKAYGKLMAIRAEDGKPAWEVRTRTPMGGGVLATAGGLVFTGDAEGNFSAYDDRDGRVLWSYQTGSGMRSGPISYLLDGKQHIAIPSGMAGPVRAYIGAGAPWMMNYRSGGTLYVFRLFEPGASGAYHGGAKTSGAPAPAEGGARP